MNTETNNISAHFWRFLLPALALFMLQCTHNRPLQVPQKEQKQAPEALEPELENLAVATFASGCFWCSEGVFEQLKGVEKVISGYSGGKENDPNYQQVSSGATSHAESIQIWYDSAQVSYSELLEVFFASHDPTTLNRQGPDVGRHYRSAIFYRTPAEQKLATQFIQKINASGEYNKPVVTEVVPFSAFWEAEPYHQDYYLQNLNDPYMRSVFQPKLKKVQENFGDKLKSK